MIGRLLTPAAAAFGALLSCGVGALAEGVSDRTRKGDRALGEYLSSECVTCHQATGQVHGGVPSIVAWPEDQFVAVLESFKNRERDNQVMQTLTSRLSTEEMEALAAYFGSLPLQPFKN